MASDEPKLGIVDLLYDDELDDKTRQAAREDIEADPQKSAELEDFEQMLAAIRGVDIDPEVPASVHDSIMEAARAKSAESTSKKARTLDREPKAAPAEPSMWSRVHSSGVSQLVMAAGVVLVAGFIFVKISGDSEPATFSTANEAVESQVTFGESSSEAKSAQPPAPEEAAEEPLAARQELADGERVEDEPAESEAVASEGDGAGPSEAEESALGELARLDRDRQPSTRSSSAPTRKRRAKSREPSKAKKSKPLDVFDDTRTKGESSLYAEPSTDDDGSADTLAQADESEDKAPRPASEGRQAEMGISDISDLGKLDQSSASGNAGSTSSGVESASRGSGASAKSADDQDSAPGVAQMESSYGAQNYDAVVDQADNFLAQSDGDAPETARVLELKALALTRQGEYTDADRVYAELQRDFPSYKSDEVARERRELAEERSKAQKRRARPSKDQEERYMDNTADEAPEPVESTIEGY